jgi:hypothetical protein
MRAAPRGGFSGLLADLLGGAKGWLNQAQVPHGVPLVGGMGAGDLTMGQAPELVDSMSYGFSPVRGAGMAATLDPAVVDLLGLMAPVAGRAGGVARGMPGVVRQAALDAYGPPVRMARSRYTLGGKEVDKAAMQQEFGFASPAPTVEEIKQARLEARRMRAEKKAQDADYAVHGGPYTRSRGGPAEGPAPGWQNTPMSNEELLRFIMERNKTLVPHKVLPNPYSSKG